MNIEIDTVKRFSDFVLGQAVDLFCLFFSPRENRLSAIAFFSVARQPKDCLVLFIHYVTVQSVSTLLGMQCVFSSSVSHVFRLRRKAGQGLLTPRKSFLWKLHVTNRLIILLGQSKVILSAIRVISVLASSCRAESKIDSIHIYEYEENNKSP